MRRADRLLQIIQLFRRRRDPVTAAYIAEELEVTTRTVYRDIAALIGSRVPIRGEAGIGYVMDEGYDLPPLMFSADELEALMLGARLVSGQGDTNLSRSADDAIAKIAAIVPEDLRPVLLDAPLYAPTFSNCIIDKVDAGIIRIAIRSRHKLQIEYSDANGVVSDRIIWPISLAYMNGVRLVIAWCELRSGFRHFRVDRMITLSPMEERIPERRDKLLSRWRREEQENQK